MDIWETMRCRHSVRKFTDKQIEQEIITKLKREIDMINAVNSFSFALFTDEPEAFKANKPSYGSFSGCRNYFALVAPKGLDEKVGYFGERLVLLSQMLGLNTCWVALTYSKGKVPIKINKGDKLYDVIALGYGLNQGVPHKNKPIEKLSNIDEKSPIWFRMGVEAAMLAPTAINQQKFYFTLIGEKTIKAKAFFGPCSKTDLGIVKYHFELGAGKENFNWAD